MARKASSSIPKFQRQRARKGGVVARIVRFLVKLVIALILLSVAFVVTLAAALLVLAPLTLVVAGGIRQASIVLGAFQGADTPTAREVADAIRRWVPMTELLGTPTEVHAMLTTGMATRMISKSSIYMTLQFWLIVAAITAIMAIRTDTRTTTRTCKASSSIFSPTHSDPSLLSSRLCSPNTTVGLVGIPSHHASLQCSSFSLPYRW